MKVLLVHSDFRAGGGAEAYADAIYDRLRKRGCDVSRLDAHGLDGDYPPLLWPAHLPILRNLNLASAYFFTASFSSGKASNACTGGVGTPRSAFQSCSFFQRK